MGVSRPHRWRPRRQHRFSTVLHSPSRSSAASDARYDQAWRLRAPNDERFRRLPCRPGKEESAKEVDDLLAPQLTADDDLARAIHAVHLEHILGEINADGINLHVDDPL